MDVNTHRDDVAPSADEMAAGMAGLEVAGVAVTAAEPLVAPAVAEAVRWLTDKKMDASYQMLFPFALGDLEIRVVVIRRMTGGQVSALLERMRAEPEKNHRWPMFFVGDAPLSDAGWEAMDDDDRFALTEIAEGFLPARFRSRSPAPTEPAAS